jgi:anti-sigma regulatory factor (Ser/Thr protein kinase)
MATRATIKVTLSGGYYFRSINRLVGDLEELFALDRENARAVVEVDLRKMTFIGPCGLALLLATLHRLRQRRLLLDGSHISLPEAQGIGNYLHRVDFYKRLFSDQDWPDYVDKGAPAGMRECKEFRSDPDDPDWGASLRGVTHELLTAIEELVATDEAAHTSLDLALSELTENVGYHADTAYGGFAAVQYLRHSHEIELAIADLGIGIAESLRRNDALASSAADDLAAIQTALTATVTSTPWRNSGYGLTFTQLLLAENDGRLLVRSGTGHVMRGANNADRIVKQRLPGTLVGMRLRTDRPLDFKAAYDLLGQAIEAVKNDASHNQGIHEAG